MLPGRRPAAELLAVVAHHPKTVARVGRMGLQVRDDVLDVAERDPVPEALLRPEDRQQPTLVLRRVRTPELLLRDRRGAEMRVVEDRPARTRRRPATSADPAPRRVPQAKRRCGARPKTSSTAAAHPAELADPVTFGKRGEHRLVVGTAEDLDLVAFDQRAETVDRIGSFGDRANRAAAPCSGATAGRPDAARAHRPSARTPSRRPRRRPSRSSRPVDGCGVRAPARCAAAHERQPASVTSGSSGGAATSMPAAGR